MEKIDFARPATYEDANLILRLYEERREEKLRAAREWFVSECKPKSLEQWKAMCPPGSAMNTNFRMVTSYWNMACSFVASGVLHEELFFQSSMEHLVVWERVKIIVPEMRIMNNAPQQMRNLETVAGLTKEWLGRQGPGVYESFAGRFTN